MSFDPDWLNRILGPRLRWKLSQLQNEVSRFQWEISNRLRAFRTRHKMCPRCRTLVERGIRSCPACGYRFGFLEATPLGRALSSVFPQQQAATPFIVGINVLFFVAGLLLSGSAVFEPGRNFFALLGPSSEIHQRMGEVSLDYLRLDGEYWRLVTANFLHAGIMHLFFNMSFLAYLGPMVERMLGRQKFVCVYFVSGVGGLGISLYSLAPYTSTIGASAAVFGLIGSALACAVVRRDPASAALRGQMVRVIIFALIFGFVVSNINNMGHIAGGILGAIITLIGGASYPRRRWHRALWNLAESGAIGLSLAAFAMMILQGR